MRNPMRYMRAPARSTKPLYRYLTISQSEYDEMLAACGGRRRGGS